MGPSAHVVIRPLPVSRGLALLTGAERTSLHLVGGLAVVLLAAIAVGALGEAEVLAGPGGLLGRAMIGPTLVAWLPLLLLHLVLALLGVTAGRRVAVRVGDEFRPMALERRRLAHSPSSRLRGVLLGVFLVDVILLVIVIVPSLMAGQGFWVLPAGLAVLAACCWSGRRALAPTAEQAGRDWDALRARWPETGTRPSAYTMSSEDLSPLPDWYHILFGTVMLVTIAAFGWSLWSVSAGDMSTAGIALASSGLFLALLVLLAVMEGVVRVRHRARTYRAFERDPRAAAEARRDAGLAPTPGTAAARELLRGHPLDAPAIVLAVLGSGALLLSTTELFVPMTGEQLPVDVATALRPLAPPGLLCVLAAWMLSSRAAYQLPVHRMLMLGAFPGMDPIPAKKKTRTDEGTDRYDVAYGDEQGDSEHAAKLADDSPR